MPNPYSYSPDEDDDLLAPKATRLHTFGDRCSCGVTHVLTNADANETIPDEVLTRLSDFIEALPIPERNCEIVVSRQDHYVAKMLSDFASFSAHVTKMNPHGPLLRALAEVVDETSGGEVTKRLRIYTTEQELVGLHLLVKSINNLIGSFEFWIRSETSGAGEVSKLKEALQETLDQTLQRLHASMDDYRLKADEVGYRVDEQLMTTGVLSNTDNFSQVISEAFADQMHETSPQES